MKNIGLIVIGLLLLSSGLEAHRGVLEDASVFGVIIYLYFVGAIIWVPILAVIGFILCVSGKCKALGVLVLFLFTVFLFSTLMDARISEDKEQERKPWHSFANMRDYAYYGNKTLYKTSNSDIVNLLWNINYYEKNGILHCDGYNVKLDTNKTLRAYCEYSTLSILTNDSNVTHYQLTNGAYKKAQKTIVDYNVTHQFLEDRNFFYTYDVYKDNNKNRSDRSKKNYFNKDNSILYISHINGTVSFKIDKEPKFAIIPRNEDEIYVIYKDEPKHIYKFSETRHSSYTNIQNIAKQVINSAYIPEWSQYHPPYKTVTEEQLKDIRTLSKSNRTRYYYKIGQLDKNTFEVNATCEDDRSRYLRFLIDTTEHDLPKLRKLEILNKK